MNAREVLEVMVRTDRGSMTVWSPDEVRNALGAYRAEVLREAAAEAEWAAGLFSGAIRGAMEGLANRFRRRADEAGKDTRSGESTRPAEQRPVNDTLAKTRAAAADMLETSTGDRRPMWRVIHTDSESPTGIAPVCTTDSDEHVIADFPGGPCPDPDGVYDCCPTPQIETDSAPMAAYLVELLNADTGGTP